MHIAAWRGELAAKPRTSGVEAPFCSARIDGAGFQRSLGQLPESELSAPKGSSIVVAPMEFDPRTPVELKLAAPVGNKTALFDRHSIKLEVGPPHGCAIRVALEGAEVVSEKN